MSTAWLKQYKEKFLPKQGSDFFKDLIGGIIVALVSIPISMGYAQIAGLPMQFGLYGSVIPIFLFGLLTSSHDFVFGVDAAPAALTGAVLATMGITAESEDAMEVVPLIALFTAVWLILFYLLRAGQVVQYISEPVMGGFVSGICCTIILMQIPKLFGGTAGTGEGIELIKHIVEQCSHFNGLSLVLGLATIVIILVSRHFIPKIPMSVLMMLVGVAVTVMFPIENLGVKLLPEVQSGFPGVHLPSFSHISNFTDMAFSSLSIAVVIMAESLLASKGNAMKDGYKLNTNREILSYAVGNLASAVTGCCPVNGSVSRTGIVRQFGAKSQWLSIFAAVTMLGVLYFGTGIIQFMPVPVLTAIVITALMGACEFHVAARLWKKSRNEFYIFVAAFLGVLLFGTVYGVVIGVVLSFVAVIIRAVVPPRSFMGVIDGRKGFYTLGRNSESKPIQNTVIYRFGGNLFFANIDTFQSDIESAVTENTKYIIVNAGAIGNVDITAADRLSMMYKDYKKKNIKFYLTEHVGEVNDQLRNYGEWEMIENGAVRMTMNLALRDAGLHLPYPTETTEPQSKEKQKKKRKLFRRVMQDELGLSQNSDILRSSRGIQAELEWAFGDDSESFKEQITEEIYKEIDRHKSLSTEKIESAEKMSHWGRLNLFDEDEFLDRLEMRLTHRTRNDPVKMHRIEDLIEMRRGIIEQRMLEMDPEVLERLKKRRLKMAEEFMKSDEEAYRRLRERRLEHIEQLRETNPSLATKYEQVYEDIFQFEETALHHLSDE